MNAPASISSRTTKDGGGDVAGHENLMTGGVVGAATTLVAWLVGRGTTRAQVAKMRGEIDALHDRTAADVEDISARTTETVANVYHGMIIDLTAQVDDLQQQVVENRVSLDADRVEISNLRIKVAELNIHAMRLQPVPGARPIVEFFNEGWYDLLNEYARNLHAVKVELHTDNVDESIINGWRLLPIEIVVPTRQLTEQQIERARVARETAARLARLEAGYEPDPEP